MTIFRKFFEKTSITNVLNKLLKKFSGNLIVSTLDGLLIYPPKTDNPKILDLISLARDKIHKMLKDINMPCRLVIIERKHEIIVGYDYNLIFLLFTRDFETGKKKICKLMDKIGEILV